MKLPNVMSPKTPALGLLTLMAGLALPAAADTVIFQSDFESANPLQGLREVTPQSVVVGDGYNGTKSLQLDRTATGAGAVRVTIPLKIEDLRGQKVNFEAMVRCADVVTPDKPWNGVKVMLVTAVGEKRNYLHAAALTGTADWRKIEQGTTIPADATEAQLQLTIEGTSGKAWFDNVKVTTGSAVAVVPVPAPLPAVPATSKFPIEINFDQPDDLKKWQGNANPAVSLSDGINGSKAILINRPAAEGPGNVRVTLPVDLTALRGQKVRFEAMVKAEDVAQPAKPWNGIKVMLHVASPAGEQWPQQPNVFGTFDWKLIGATATIPQDATGVDLTLGLEATSGKVWFDNVRIVPVN